MEKCTGAAAGPLGTEGITIRNTVCGVEVFSDPLIEKVFFSLLENSLQHGGHVCMVGFSASDEKCGLVLWYHDTGGIPKEDKRNNYQKGFARHTGPGLFLSREILAITGNPIQENGERCQGARFEILVPEGAFRWTGRD